MLMKKTVQDDTFIGIKLNRHCLTLSHLFIDDSIFFLERKIQECQNLGLILNQYCYTSGQQINLNKSGILLVLAAHML